jgi:hypothetical protein
VSCRTRFKARLERAELPKWDLFSPWSVSQASCSSDRQNFLFAGASSEIDVKPVRIQCENRCDSGLHVYMCIMVMDKVYHTMFIYNNYIIASSRKWSVLTVNPCEVGGVQSFSSVVASSIHSLLASIDGFMDD